MTVAHGELAKRWCVLHRLSGSARLRHLLNQFGDLDGICTAGRTRLAPFFEDQPETIDTILRGPENAVTDLERDWLTDPANHLLAITDSDYPALLREIADAPPLLYVRGEPALLARPQLAVVGSRNPTRGGVDNAEAFAAHLARAGLVITSGLALGIDAAAHRATLEANGFTIAVAATGLDRVYPASHRELAHAISAHGALVSDFPLGMPPKRENFPQRNRLISGLSLGVLVVEAAERSGSLITARLAAEQGREVFAIPGSIHSPLARGCHKLIRQGAKLVETAQDILEELGPLAQVAAQQVESPTIAPKLAPEQTALLELIGYDPVDMDTLVARSGLTAAELSSMLLHMELHGLVEARPGGRYQRTP
jgi:DNA processing protein